MIYLQWILYDGDGRKTPKYTKNEYENKGKNSPFGCPPIPPSTKMETDCFPVSENKLDLPWVERGSLSSGEKIQCWARYGQMKAGNMIFIHMNFQDLQQKRAGCGLRYKNNGDGEDLGN